MFFTNLATVKLPFELAAQMRCWEFPAFNYPDERGVGRRFPGFPPKYYYFVPGSTYGGHKDFQADPLDPSFVASIDGLGFNFACPLRLHAALKVLGGLPEGDRKEVLDGLAVATKHIATTEELFAAGIWYDTLSIRRPPVVDRNVHDWNVTFAGGGLHLECKYRPALWPQMDEDFELGPGAFAKKAANQLPAIPSSGWLNVLAVIGVCPMNGSLRTYCARELRDHSVVDVLVYLNTMGDMYVFSASGTKARQVQRLITPIAVDDFGPFSPFAFFRPERQRRQAARQSAASTIVSSIPARVEEVNVKTLPPRRGYLILPPGAYPYRCIERRLPDGEPEFTFIPPFLPEQNANS